MAETRSPLAQLAAPSVPWFHGAPVTSLALDPAGRLLLAASHDCVRLMRVESGETVRVMPGFPGKLSAVGRWVFVAGGARIAGYALDDEGPSLRVWSLDGEELARHEGEHIGPIIDAAGDRVVVEAPKSGIRVWDLGTGRVVFGLDRVQRTLTAAALDAAGERLYIATSAQNPEVPTEAIVEHEVFALPGGATIASRSHPGRNIGFRQPGGARARFLPGGGVLTPGHGAALEKLGPDLAIETSTQAGRCLDLALAPDGESALLTIGNMHADPAYEFRLHSAERVRLADLAVRPLDLDAWSVAILPDGRHVLGLKGGVLRGDAVTEPRNPRRFVSAGTDGGELLVGDDEGTVLRVDPVRLEVAGELPEGARARVARADGRMTRDGAFHVVSGGLSAPHLVVRDATGTLWQDGTVTAYALAPDSKTIVCGRALSIGGLTRRDLRTGAILSQFSPYSSQVNSGRLTAVALSPSGRVAASDMDGVVMIYEKGDKRGFGAPHYDLRVPIRSLAWHPDEKRLAIGLGGDRGSIFVTGDAPLTLAGHHADVRALWFTPDGLRLVSAGNDGQIFVWEIS